MGLSPRGTSTQYLEPLASQSDTCNHSAFSSFLLFLHFDLTWHVLRQLTVGRQQVIMHHTGSATHGKATQGNARLDKASLSHGGEGGEVDTHMTWHVSLSVRPYAAAASPMVWHGFFCPP